MFRNLITNILMAFMKPSIDRAAETLRNDPEIKQKFKEVEHALQELKDATEREREFHNSEENKALKAKYGFKGWT